MKKHEETLHTPVIGEPARDSSGRFAAPVAEPKPWGERGKVNFRAKCPNKSFGGCLLCEGHPGECQFDDPPPVGTPTPGPWRVRSKCSPGNPQVEQDSAEHPQICCALDHRPSDYANMRLIAAAPETARQRDELAAEVEALRHRAQRLEARFSEVSDECYRERADAKEFRLLAMELTKQRDELLAALELLLRQTGQEAILQARAAVRNAGGRVPAHAAMEQLERCQPAEKGYK